MTKSIYDSDVAGSGSAGLKSFDASSYLQTDLTAGRSYSVFALSGSRDTYGAISTAETGSGPYLVVSAIPEPSTYAAITALLALSWSASWPGRCASPTTVRSVSSIAWRICGWSVACALPRIAGASMRA